MNKPFGLPALVGLWGVLLLAGCANPVVSSLGSVPGTGSISVQFPSGAGRSGLINVTKASTFSNFYEVIAYNASNLYFINSNTSNKANSGGGTLANMSPGTYTLVALAGLATGDTITPAMANITFQGNASSAPNVVLLGSASATGVTVTAGTTTNQALTLTNVLYNITGTQTVPVNSSYSVTISGDTGSPMLVPLSSFVEGYQGSAPNSLSSVTFDAQAWTITANYTAGSSAGSNTVSFTNRSMPVAILDPATTGYALGNAKYLPAVTGTYWNICPVDSLPGYVSGGYDTSIAPGSALVNFSTGGIASTLTWGVGR
ncbi:MAG TPA: hypothetical protein VMB23_07535 [Spirochaetia bacterium]|nr:hypothetical protein [Spirochaetia bacterium]